MILNGPFPWAGARGPARRVRPPAGQQRHNVPECAQYPGASANKRPAHSIDIEAKRVESSRRRVGHGWSYGYLGGLMSRGNARRPWRSHASPMRYAYTKTRMHMQASSRPYQHINLHTYTHQRTSLHMLARPCVCVCPHAHTHARVLMVRDHTWAM